MDQNNNKSPVLVAFGIPSHDFTFLVPDKKIVQQYNLELDNQKTSRDLLYKIRNDLQSNDITKHIISVCKKNRKTIVVGISGTHIFNKYAIEMLECVKIANILIGNQNEFDKLCEHLHLKGDMISRIWKCHEIMSDESESLPCMKHYKKIIIVTNGHLRIYYAYGQTTNIGIFNVPSTSPHEISVDTTGAGDSFLGAFLYGLIRNMSINECLKMTCEIVVSVITSHGYSIPPIPINTRNSIKPT